MKVITIFSLGTIIFYGCTFETRAIECPLVQDVLRTMKCTNQGANLYSCRYDHSNWTGNFQSAVDITQSEGSNQFLGRGHENACTYSYKSPTLQVNYNIVHK